LSLPINKIICGDAIEVMRTFPADSIDLVVTSPPYWGLRDFGPACIRVWGGDPNCEHEWETPHRDFKYSGGTCEYIGQFSSDKTRFESYSAFCRKCGAWRGQLGLEPHPQMFIDHMVEICREIKRILKPSGSMWLNFGDTYFSKIGAPNTYLSSREPKIAKQKRIRNILIKQVKKSPWFQPKQLLGIPWRVAIALQHDGWILRNAVIWHKPNAMPESVKDRLSTTYEYFFFFVKNRRYYFDLDAIRVPHVEASVVRSRYPVLKFGTEIGAKLSEASVSKGHKFVDLHPLGKNPGDVWSIPTEPFPDAHFATFPTRLIEPIIKACCPRWICRKCGKPRRRIVKVEYQPLQRNPDKNTRYGVHAPPGVSPGGGAMPFGRARRLAYTVDWTDCGCRVGWEPGIVLDPFCGSGTTLLVARRLGRRFIGIDINPEYVEMAWRRVKSGEKYRPRPEDVADLAQFMEAVMVG